jgi:hypothetical protein
VTAASKGCSSVVEYLLTVAGLDIFARNLQNETAFDIAAERADIRIYQTIEAHERHLWAKKNPIRKSIHLLPLTCLVQGRMFPPIFIMSSHTKLLRMHVSTHELGVHRQNFLHPQSIHRTSLQPRRNSYTCLLRPILLSSGLGYPSGLFAATLTCPLMPADGVFLNGGMFRPSIGPQIRPSLPRFRELGWFRRGCGYAS